MINVYFFSLGMKIGVPVWGYLTYRGYERYHPTHIRLAKEKIKNIKPYVIQLGNKMKNRWKKYIGSFNKNSKITFLLNTDDDRFTCEIVGDIFICNINKNNEIDTSELKYTCLLPTEEKYDKLVWNFEAIRDSIHFALEMVCDIDKAYEVINEMGNTMREELKVWKG